MGVTTFTIVSNPIGYPIILIATIHSNAQINLILNSDLKTSILFSLIANPQMQKKLHAARTTLVSFQQSNAANSNDINDTLKHTSSLFQKSFQLLIYQILAIHITQTHFFQIAFILFSNVSIERVLSKNSTIASE